MIGYGGMLTESFVAIMALVTACILDQHLYFALNAPDRAHRWHPGDRGRHTSTDSGSPAATSHRPN